METQFLACVRLRACYRAGLIKSQNAFARKKSQNSNALWVQKLSGCTIFHRIIMLPGPGPGSVLCMIRERHVILKVTLHFRLAV